MLSADFMIVLTATTGMTMGIVQAIKKAINPAKGVVIAISFLVALGVCAVNEEQSGAFNLLRFALLTILTFVQANGWYLVVEQMAEKVGSKP